MLLYANNVNIRATVEMMLYNIPAAKNDIFLFV